MCGDQVLPEGYYSNKRPPQGILKASVQEAITEQQRRIEGLNKEISEVEPKERRIRDQLARAKVSGPIHTQQKSE